MNKEEKEMKEKLLKSMEADLESLRSKRLKGRNRFDKITKATVAAGLFVTGCTYGRKRIDLAIIGAGLTAMAVAINKYFYKLDSEPYLAEIKMEEAIKELKA